MKYRNWTEEQLQFLLNNYGSMPVVKIAEAIQKSVGSIFYILKKENYEGWSKTVKKTVSYGVEQVETILRELYPSLKIEKEYHIGERLRLDLYLPAIDLGIEYDGVQHFLYTPAFHKSEEDFKRAKVNDKRKEELCLLRGINLIRIRYDEEVSKELLRKKIQETGYGSGEIADDAILSYKEKKERLQKKVLQNILLRSAEQIEEIIKKAATVKKAAWPARKIQSRPFPKKVKK